MDTEKYQKQYDELCAHYTNQEWTEAVDKGKALAGNHEAPRFYQVQAAIIVAQASDTMAAGETWLEVASTLLLGWRYRYAPWSEEVVSKELADHWEEVEQQLKDARENFEEEEDDMLLDKPEAAEPADLGLLKVLASVSNVAPVVVVAGETPSVAETASATEGVTAPEHHQIATPTHAPSEPLDTVSAAEPQFASEGYGVATPIHSQPDPSGTIIGLHTPAFDPSATSIFGTATIIPLRPARDQSEEASREGVRISTILRDVGWTDEIQLLPGLTTEPLADESLAGPSRAPQVQQQTANPDPLAIGLTAPPSANVSAAGSRSMPQLQHYPGEPGPSATGT